MVSAGTRKKNSLSASGVTSYNDPVGREQREVPVNVDFRQPEEAKVGFCLCNFSLLKSLCLSVIGAANAGKSTLMNRLVSQKVAKYKGSKPL